MKYEWIIYKAVCRVNGKIYIGHTRNLPRRMNAHRNAAQNGSRFPFHAAIRKHGWESFEFSILRRFASETAAKAAEKRFITAQRSQDRSIGYNVADGGDGIGSRGAIEVHSRPDFRKELLKSMPSRHAKAQATKQARGINKLAGIKAAATKAAKRAALANPVP